MNPNSENGGLPTFNLTLSGISAESPYFLLDFSASQTVAWGVDC